MGEDRLLKAELQSKVVKPSKFSDLHMINKKEQKKKRPKSKQEMKLPVPNDDL